MSGDADHDRGRSGDDLNLTAYSLEQLDEAERQAIERQLSETNGDGRRLVEETRRLGDEVRAALTEVNPTRSESLRDTLVHRMKEEKEDAKPQPVEKTQSFWRRHAVSLGVAAALLVLVASLLFPAVQSSREVARQMESSNKLRQLAGRSTWHEEQNGVSTEAGDADGDRRKRGSGRGTPAVAAAIDDSQSANAPRSEEEAKLMMKNSMKIMAKSMAESSRHQTKSASPAADGYGTVPMGTQTGPNSYADSGMSNGDQSGGGKRSDGQATPFYAAVPHGWTYRADGQQSGPRQERGIDGQGQGQGVSPNGLGGRKDGLPIGAGSGEGQVDPRSFGDMMAGMGNGRGPAGMDRDLLTDMMGGGMMPGGPGTEQYAPIVENAFIQVQGIDALSTFSIDVDTASYANVRRFLNQGQLPPPNAVRIEELVNYFSYDYPQPKAGEPFSVNMEVAECPWQPRHHLLRVGLKGREIHHKERPVSNLVFLLDVSGSMSDQNKLPLLKQVLSMMVRELREDDRVSIVTYAGEAGLRLPPTTGDQQEKILAAIDSLSAGGSTNGSAGIELAYDQARGYFRKEGTNRVILATDGDLNVGVTDDESLVQLIKQKAAGGVFLTVLGFGEGNLKDAKMERLADNGNGLFAYIDSVREGRKVLIEQMSGSLVTIAKDVKIQIEFNPAQVQSYRLIGYENRMLTAPEFSDDQRDAGEIGAGHSVTALYELVPAGQSPDAPGNAETPTLRYQAAERAAGSGFRGQEQKLTGAANSGELLTLKLRYKEPDGQASKLSEYPLKDRGGKFNAASKDFQFAAAVASFGMQLRHSQYRGEGNLAAVAEIAASAIGEDKGGYRAEFVDLVRKAQQLRPVAAGPVNTDY
jgi:Ca-activated chloride channel family protein